MAGRPRGWPVRESRAVGTVQPGDETALASTLKVRRFPPGSVLPGGGRTSGVWIICGGRIELSVGPTGTQQTSGPGHTALFTAGPHVQLSVVMLPLGPDEPFRS